MPPAAERPSMPASLARPSATPPERLVAGPLVLRRVEAADAPVVAAAGGASLAHLRPWMGGARPAAGGVRTQLLRAAEADELWETGAGFIYVMIARDSAPDGPPGSAGSRIDPDGEFVGTIGMHRRAADDAVEIGYWIASAKTRRGYATAAARAITPVALELSSARRAEIPCDEANTASAAIPRRRGYPPGRVRGPHRGTAEARGT